MGDVAERPVLPASVPECVRAGLRGLSAGRWPWLFQPAARAKRVCPRSLNSPDENIAIVARVSRRRSPHCSRLASHSADPPENSGCQASTPGNGKPFARASLPTLLVPLTGVRTHVMNESAMKTIEH
eukprot:scaffold1928_cov381-Prasinococcus_capsulatus_cf.AAC.15